MKETGQQETVSNPNIISSRRNIYVISDTHFNHMNIIKYCDRPWYDADSMNWDMVERWNSVVKDEDIVYHLGDVYMGSGFSTEYTKNLLSKLKGRKRLVLGNHDNGKDQILQNVFQKISVWRMFPEFGLLLTHVPVHESSLTRGNPDGPIKETSTLLRNVHGHIHDKEAPSKNHRCVCVEQTNYCPVNIEELRKW